MAAVISLGNLNPHRVVNLKLPQKKSLQFTKKSLLNNLQNNNRWVLLENLMKNENFYQYCLENHSLPYY